MTTQAHRILLSHDDRGPQMPLNSIWRRGRWRAHWLTPPAGATVPFIAAYRLRFSSPAVRGLRVHVSADERFRFFVDGVEALIGPERGEPQRWRFHTLELDLDPGEHVLAAQVWALGAQGPWNQPSAVPGFILGVDGDEDAWHDRLATGAAAWECRPLEAFSVEVQPHGMGTGVRTVLDGARLPWDWAVGVDGGEGAFFPARRGHQGFSDLAKTDRQPPVLVPARLPPQVDAVVPNGQAVLVDEPADRDAESQVADPTYDLSDERRQWQAWLDGATAIELPARTRRRCLVDLGIYRSVWPSLRAAGAGGQVRLRYAEALYIGRDGRDKGDRREWQQRFLRGAGPVFRTASGPVRTYEVLDWECGRFIEIIAAAGDQPLRLEKLVHRATGYPFVDEGSFTADDPRLQRLRALAVHTMAVGTHETYCDCPYYERLQYVGDTRLEALITYAMQGDDRLPRQAIDAFAASRTVDGLTQSRWPARGVQVIPPFSLWWIHMVADHALWRADTAFIASHLVGVRGVLDAWWAFRNQDGLIEAPAGWNFVDWVPTWDSGMPPGADLGVSSILNWHFAWTLMEAARLEDALGEPELAALNRRRATAVAQALKVCWDDQRGRWRDAPGATTASEHGQILPLLSGLLDQEQARRTAASLASDSDLARTTIYFTHYLFEAYRQIGRADLLFDRLGLWFDLEARGLTTTPESPEPTRSDCHPWGAHPLFHLSATVAGIRPASLGFAIAEILPQPGPLRQIHARIPHPAGFIQLDLERSGTDLWQGQVSAPVPMLTPGGRLAAGQHTVRWRLGSTSAR